MVKKVKSIWKSAAEIRDGDRLDNLARREPLILKKHNKDYEPRDDWKRHFAPCYTFKYGCLEEDSVNFNWPSGFSVGYIQAKGLKYLKCKTIGEMEKKMLADLPHHKCVEPECCELH